MSLYFLNFNFSQLKLSVSDFFVQSCANTFKNTSRKYCHIIHCDSITEKYEARTLFLPNLGLGIILSFKFYFFKNLVNFYRYRASQKNPILAPARACELTCIFGEIDYKLTTLDLYKGETRTPEFLKINPAHCVPTLKDGDLGSENFEFDILQCTCITT